MKRATLLLATAFLGMTAGCSSRSCEHQNDLNVFWPQFTDASGNTFACTDPRSGVAGIQVFVDDNAQFQSPVACVPFPGQSPTQGITLVDFAPGTYKIEVQAYDANGALLYDDVANVTIARTCGGTDFTARPVAVQGPLDIAYTLPPPVTQCPANSLGGSFVWFSLTGLSPGTTSFVVDGLHGNPESFACGNPFPLPIDAPFGTYRLDFVQIVTRTGNTTTPYAAVYQNCTPQTVNHLGSDVIDVPLASATANCP